MSGVNIGLLFLLAVASIGAVGVVRAGRSSSSTYAMLGAVRSSAQLVSYAVGCMMGRYSLDEPGLIYAHSGNEGFEVKFLFATDSDISVAGKDT